MCRINRRESNTLLCGMPETTGIHSLRPNQPLQHAYDPMRTLARFREQFHPNKWPQLRTIKRHWPVLETRLFHTIEDGVTKIIPQRYLQENKRPVVLRGSAARRCKSAPMCDHSTACNLHRNIQHEDGAFGYT